MQTDITLTGQTIASPAVGDDLALYLSSTAEQRQSQFVATLQLVRDLRAQIERDKAAMGIECLFGDTAYEMFDYLSLLFNNAHIDQRQAVIPGMIDTWHRIGDKFNSLELKQAFDSYLKASLQAADVLRGPGDPIGSVDVGRALTMEFLTPMITESGVNKTQAGLDAVAEYERTLKMQTTEAGLGSSFATIRLEAFEKVLAHLEYVYSMAGVVATAMTHIAPSVSFEVARTAMRKSAYHFLLQAMFLHDAALHIGQLEFNTTQMLSTLAGSKQYERFLAEIAKIEDKTKHKEQAARLARAMAAEHLKEIGHSLAMKANVVVD